MKESCFFVPGPNLEFDLAIIPVHVRIGQESRFSLFTCI
jgi:hypothetical protein